MSTHSAILKGLACSQLSGGFPFPLYVQLNYTTKDPHAVTLSFSETENNFDQDGIARWTFGRELMRSGLTAKHTAPAGMGDVQCSLSDGGVNFMLKLSSPYGECEVLLQLEEVQFFINTVFTLFPDETISDADLDAELKQLLEG